MTRSPAQLIDSLRKKREELVSQGKREEAYEPFKDIVNSAARDKLSRDIVMESKKGDYTNENVYLVDRLIENAENSVRLFVNRIDDSVYGNTIARNNLRMWLMQKADRKLFLLLKDGGSFEKSVFYYQMKEFVESRQIKVKALNIKSRCNVYAAMFDETAFKIKIIEDNNEVMIGNFRSEDLVAEMVDLFNRIFRNPNLSLSMKTSQKISDKFGLFDLKKIDDIGDMVNFVENNIRATSDHRAPIVV